MEIENVIETHMVERVCTLSVVRTVDFEKLAASSTDGRIDVTALTSGGDWGVKVAALRGDDAVTHEVAGPEAAAGFVAGFLAAVERKKRGPRSSNGAGAFDPKTITTRAQLNDPERNLTKPMLITLADLHGVTYKQNDKKADIAANISKKLPAK